MCSPDCIRRRTYHKPRKLFDPNSETMPHPSPKCKLLHPWRKRALKFRGRVQRHAAASGRRRRRRRRMGRESALVVAGRRSTPRASSLASARRRRPRIGARAVARARAPPLAPPPRADQGTRLLECRRARPCGASLIVIMIMIMNIIYCSTLVVAFMTRVPPPRSGRARSASRAARRAAASSRRCGAPHVRTAQEAHP